MEREKIINIGPICRFGPGGDFASNWPDEWEIYANQSHGVFTKLMNMFVGMIDALRGSDADYEIKGPVDVTESTEQEILEQGTTSYATNDRRTANASAGPVIEQNIGFSLQPGLFADDWRAGRNAGYKPNNRIRAHRAVAKKRICFGQAGPFDKAQGTLFDAELKSAKTA
jgi:hypothetical protein